MIGFLLSIFAMATIMLTFFKGIGSIWLFRLLSMVSRAIFWFCSLPSGLSTSPYVFTTVLRPVVAHWRSQGIRISVYLDDGIGADSNKDSCSQEAQLVLGDLDRLGLLVNEEKSNVEPRQKAGDLTKGEFSIPPGEIDPLFNLISLLLDDVSPAARDVLRITGTLTSMELALGPVVRLRTRALLPWFCSRWW